MPDRPRRRATSGPGCSRRPESRVPPERRASSRCPARPPTGTGSSGGQESAFRSCGHEPRRPIRWPRNSRIFALPTPVDNSPGRDVPRLELRAPGTLDPRHTFATFLIGSCNRFAHAACRAVAGEPGAHYNPLLIHGPSGVGKTHLATAIGHALLERTPSARVTQLSADAFMRDLLNALRSDRMDSFKRHLRDVDLLIVDDVQLLAGRQRTQEEFFHTFNALHDLGRQIVLTADRAPKAIPRLEERLCNRFEWGLVVEIQALDAATKLALLARHAGVVPLPDEVARLLAE